MKKYRIDEITENLDNLRKPLNSIQRSRISQKKLYPYYGANSLIDYVDEYIFDEEILCVAEDGGSWGYKEKCTYIVNEKCWVNNHAHVQQCTDECNMVYLMYHINFMDISIWVTGIDQKKLNRANLDTIPIALPPIELQEQFADFVKQVNKSKVEVQKALDETQKLFDSLMQQYFG